MPEPAPPALLTPPVLPDGVVLLVPPAVLVLVAGVVEAGVDEAATEEEPDTEMLVEVEPDVDAEEPLPEAELDESSSAALVRRGMIAGGLVGT